LTANELLALLGLAWPRLLLYPGGLTAFAVVWLMERPGWRRRTAPSAGEQVPAALPCAQAISAVVLPWLGLALLPLPQVARLTRQTDLIVVLALLEWPLVLTIAGEFCASTPDGDARLVRRLAAVLNSYPPLILAALALAAGSFEVGALTRPLDASAPSRLVELHWLGALAWTLALPPALGLGPFAAGPPAQCWLRIGLRLRALGLVALGALPWFPLFGDRPWLLPLPPLLIAALLWGYDRVAGGSARGWARGYLVLAAALLLALLWAAASALQERLA
jgi:hypothetical protein